MASVLSYVPLVNRLVGSGSDAESRNGDLDSLAPIQVHNVETAPEKRPRTLKHLLRANHVNHSLLYNNLRFDNHVAHALSSAYLLGADDKQLHRIYEAESASLEPWTPSPAELHENDWRAFLGDKDYQRAFLDFYEDSLVMHHGYDWKKVVDEFMYQGEEPLLSSLIGGLGHPLIHLGYAYEMDNREVAMEALALTSVQYDFLHKYTDDPKYTRPAGSQSSSSPRELLDRMAADPRLTSLFAQPGFVNFDALFEKHEDLVLEYWNAWDVGAGGSPLAAFRASQEAAAALLVATVPPGARSYGFFTVHLLTTSHAVRVLLPLVPARLRLPLVRQWWLLTVAVYMIQLCPPIRPEHVGDGGGRAWNYVEERALNGPFATDAHFIKAVRAMREAARTWGDVDETYLHSAVRFVDDFNGWTF